MSSCAMQVELPASVRTLVAKPKAKNEIDFENRSAERISTYCEGLLTITSVPTIVRNALNLSENNQVRTVVKDISRSGIAVYYHQQMYPLQTFEVEFQGRVIAATVVRCRYIKQLCYEIGATIDSVQSSREPRMLRSC